MAIPNRPSIYLSAAAGGFLESIMRDDDSLSGTINYIVLNFSRLLDDGKKYLANSGLSEGEWSSILDANNGTIIDHNSATMLWANVYDSEGLKEKWGVDVADLADKMRGLPLGAQLALADAVRAFWAKPGDIGEFLKSYLP